MSLKEIIIAQPAFKRARAVPAMRDQVQRSIGPNILCALKKGGDRPRPGEGKMSGPALGAAISTSESTRRLPIVPFVIAAEDVMIHFH